MNTNIILNGNNIKIKLQNTESFSLESFNKSIDDLQNQSKQINVLNQSLEKMTNIFDIVSNVKAMESIGYTSTEGLGDNLKEAGKKIIEKVKEIIKRIKEWVKKVVGFIINQIKRFIAFIKSKFSKTKPLCKEDLERLKSVDIPSNKTSSNEIPEYKLESIKFEIKKLQKIKQDINESIEDYLKFKDDTDFVKSNVDIYFFHLDNLLRTGVKIPNLSTSLKTTLIKIENRINDKQMFKADDFNSKIERACEKNDKNQLEIPKEVDFNIKDVSLESFQAWEGVSNDVIQLGQSIDRILYVCKKAKEENISWDLSKYFNEIEKDLKELEKISDIEFLRDTSTVGADKLANIETDISNQANTIKLKLSKINNVFNNNDEEMKSDININSESSLKSAIKELSQYIPNKSDADKYINSVKTYAEQKVDKLKDYCNKLNKYCDILDRNAKTSPQAEMKRLNTKVQALRSIHGIYNGIILDLQSTLNFSSTLLSAKEKLNKVYNVK